MKDIALGQTLSLHMSKYSLEIHYKWHYVSGVHNEMHSYTVGFSHSFCLSLMVASLQKELVNLKISNNNKGCRL